VQLATAAAMQCSQQQQLRLVAVRKLIPHAKKVSGRISLTPCGGYEPAVQQQEQLMTAFGSGRRSTVPPQSTTATGPDTLY
jgi:hypothetical protein